MDLSALRLPPSFTTGVRTHFFKEEEEREMGAIMWKEEEEGRRGDPESKRAKESLFKTIRSSFTLLRE